MTILSSYQTHSLYILLQRAGSLLIMSIMYQLSLSFPLKFMLFLVTKLIIKQGSKLWMSPLLESDWHLYKLKIWLVVNLPCFKDSKRTVYFFFVCGYTCVRAHWRDCYRTRNQDVMLYLAAACWYWSMKIHLQKIMKNAVLLYTKISIINKAIQ